MTLSLPSDYRLLALDAVGSTNDLAKEHAEQGAAAGLVVWAQQQTAGRGRRGRAWTSPVGNLYGSVLLRPKRPVADWGTLSFVAALALAEAVTPFVPQGADRVRLKWPNDVLVDGAKVSGILLETVPDQNALVVGMGVNVQHAPEGTPYPATCLGADVAVADVLSALIHRLAHWVSVWEESGFAALKAPWLAHSKGVGQPLVARLTDREYTGVFNGLDDDGALLLVEENGQERRILAGDVFFPAAKK